MFQEFLSDLPRSSLEFQELKITYVLGSLHYQLGHLNMETPYSKSSIWLSLQIVKNCLFLKYSEDGVTFSVLFPERKPKRV